MLGAYEPPSADHKIDLGSVHVHHINVNNLSVSDIPRTEPSACGDLRSSPEAAISLWLSFYDFRLIGELAGALVRCSLRTAILDGSSKEGGRTYVRWPRVPLTHTYSLLIYSI